MDPQTLTSFLDSIVLAIQQSSIVALKLQNSVQNQGKDIAHLDSDTTWQKEIKLAKTVVDEIIQDILLLQVKKLFGSEIVVDAEEDSLLKSSFSSSKELSIVIDPIDGTYEYLKGEDSYSVCVGLLYQGKVMTALVGFPARNQLYFTDENKKAYLADDYLVNGIKNKKEILIPPAPKVLHKNNRVSEEFLAHFTADGYKIVDDTEKEIGCSLALLEVIEGQAEYYVSATRSIRDILLGPIIAASPNGFAVDYQGNDLVWPQTGRVPEAIFGAGDKNKLLEILKA